MSGTRQQYNFISCYNGAVPRQFWRQGNYSGVAYVNWFIQKGRVTLKSEGQTLRAREGDWVFTDPLTMKSHNFTPNAQILSLHFSVNWNRLPYFPPLQKPFLYRGESCELMAEAAREFISFWESHLRAAEESPSVEAVRGRLMYNWLALWHEVRNDRPGTISLPANRRILKLIDCLSQKVGVTPVDYAALRQVVGLSQAQINRIFRESTGLTPKQWKDTLCLKSAEELLLESDLSIKEIAGKLKFVDTSHFVKWFRGRMNQTPSRWRKLHYNPDLS